MAGPVVEIGSPVRTDRTGGISKVATFRPNSRLGAVQSLVFQSDGCTFPQISEHLCYTGAASPASKSFDGIEIEDAIGAPFPLYAGVMCLAGPDPDELERAQRALEKGRDRALEEELYAWAQGGLSLGIGETVTGAVALVEQALDDAYVGQGVILMSRADAVRADAEGAIHANLDGIPTTVNGTPVLASGRVESGLVFGLGAIVVEHGNPESREVVETRMNRHWALAEEVYAIAVDCAYRVRASTTDTAPPAAPAVLTFAQSGTYADDSTQISFSLTFSGATPEVTLQWQQGGAGWVDVADEPSVSDDVYTWDLDAAANGFAAAEEIDFQVVLTNAVGSDTSDTVTVTVAASGG